MSGKNLILLLLATATLMILMVFGNFISNHMKDPSLYSLNVSNQPTIGSSKSSTDVVVFLDPKCPSCKNYNNTIFPKIQKEYIDTNKIKYTAIIVSYVNGSMPYAEALLCTYYQDEGKVNGELFFKFLNAIYETGVDGQEENIDAILEIGKKADASIHVDKIKKCVENNVYHTRIMQNNAEGVKATSGHLENVVIFVNGVKMDIHEPEKIFKALDNGDKAKN